MCFYLQCFFRKKRNKKIAFGAAIATGGLAATLAIKHSMRSDQKRLQELKNKLADTTKEEDIKELKIKIQNLEDKIEDKKNKIKK